MMTYYLTKTNPLVFTTQKAEKVEEWMISAMLELLLRREYEMYEPKEAKDNLQYVLQSDEVFNEVIAPPTELTQESSRLWIQDLLESKAGRLLLSQVGQPLHKQRPSETSLTDETTLSDLLPSLWNPAEADVAQGWKTHTVY
jgi:hypothetical protein